MRVYKVDDKYGVDLTWHGGRIRMVCYTDKRATRAFGDKLESLAACKEAGERPDRELTLWLENLPQNIKSKLVKHGLIDNQKLEASKKLKDHIEDYKSSMIARNRTGGHVKRESSAIVRACTDCRFTKIGDFDAGKLNDYLIKRLEEVSPRTANACLVAMKAFCNWLVRVNRIVSNPFNCLQKFDEQADIRRKRRALSDIEYARFIEATEKGDHFRKMSGKEWALLFRLAAETGFRWNELRSLTRIQFTGLDTDSPCVFLKGEDAKNGKAFTQPLRMETAKVLNEHLALKLPSAKAFNMPSKDCGAEVVRHYLDMTGNKEQGITPIPYEDQAGRYFDFHALRGQFATSLARSGVSLAAARELMRHSTVDLTAKHYTHFSLEDRREAISKLPNEKKLHPVRERKTGTCEADMADQIGAEKICHISAKILPNSTDSTNTELDTSGQKQSETVYSSKPVSHCEANRKALQTQGLQGLEDWWCWRISKRKDSPHPNFVDVNIRLLSICQY